MKIVLYFDTVEEFSLFILSAAALEFEQSPEKAITFGRCLPREKLWPFMSHVFEVHVEDVIYTVTEDKLYSQPADFRIVNYMLNSGQVEADYIYIHWGNKGDSEIPWGSNVVREALAKLPQSFSLEIGWRTDYSNYIFCRK